MLMRLTEIMHSLRGDKEILLGKEEELASFIQETTPTSYRP
jgi:hypothetical protein